MQKFKLPQNVSNLSGLIFKMRADAASRLSKFCTQQILDKRLSTKTFNYEFDISGSRSGAQRKSVQKLKEILYKHVKKQIPYLDYIRSGENFISTVSGRPNGVHVKLESPFFPIVVNRARSDYSIGASQHKWFVGISRYCRMLKYKAIKNGIPLTLIPNLECSIHPSDLEGFENWWKKKEGDFELRVKINVNIRVDLVIFQYNPYVTEAEDNPEYTYEEYEAKLVAAGNREQLKRFRDASRWSEYALTSRSRIRYYPGLEKYITPEKIFMVLDEIIKVIITFTRRVQYDTSAFNVGSVETT